MLNVRVVDLVSDEAGFRCCVRDESRCIQSIVEVSAIDVVYQAVGVSAEELFGNYKSYYSVQSQA